MSQNAWNVTETMPIEVSKTHTKIEEKVFWLLSGFTQLFINAGLLASFHFSNLSFFENSFHYTKTIILLLSLPTITVLLQDKTVSLVSWLFNSKNKATLFISTIIVNLLNIFSSSVIIANAIQVKTANSISTAILSIFMLLFLCIDSIQIKKMIHQSFQFTIQAFEELKKVKFMPLNNVLGSTFVVCIVIVFFKAFLQLSDSIITTCLKFIFN